MGVLNDEFTRAFEEMWTGPSARTHLLKLILRKRGCSVSDVELERLTQAANEGADRIELPDGGGLNLSSISHEEVDEAILDLEKQLETSGEEIVTSTVEQIAPSVLKSLYDALPGALREWHTLQRAFERRLRHRWKTGLDRLDMLITMAHEAGEIYAQDLRRESAEADGLEEPMLIEVLTALHCRACRTAREIVCLLKAGYADGAEARWRSLHELAVTAFFLLEHRSDTPQRYLEHAAVERWRAAKEYQQHYTVLGYEPFSDEELSEMEKEAEAAIKNYGTPFKEDYGWAANILGNPRPTFTQLENSLQMSHWRPYFRLACQSVHAGSRGLFFSLGEPKRSTGMLLAGASDAGLADPGHQMAVSLTMVTVAFLTAQPNIDGLVACHCMRTLCDDIGVELVRADESANSD